MKPAKNPDHVTFRLAGGEAEALCTAARGKGQSPGQYAREATVDRIHGNDLSSVRELLFRLQRDVAEMRQRMTGLSDELAAFRQAFEKALPEG